MTSDADHYVGDFPLILKRHPRARNLKLRYEAKSGAALLTLPPGVSDRKALQFANKHHDWLLDQYDSAPEVIPLAAGEHIPYLGRSILITHASDKAATVDIRNDQIIVGGSLPGFETRLQNWLKKQARLALNKAGAEFEPRLGRHPHKVMIRDTQSRWGSCSSRKTLSFSWRLIMARPDILRYVVAHEMAHLVEMNHGPSFWTLVEKLYPDWKTARRWLKTDGRALMLIG
ncbi:MAG: M48 family metallopeptidase [Emcibacter sp.]|nr:M48 family metallopeptidase [Emcibacter sp.]